MATSIVTTIEHYIGMSADRYVLLAIVAGVISFVSFWQGYTAVGATAVIGAIVAAGTAASAQYASTGSIPGTSIPIHTLVVWGIAALVAALEYLAGLGTTYTPETLIAATLVFLVYLLNEVKTSGTPSVSGTPVGESATGSTPPPTQ